MESIKLWIFSIFGAGIVTSIFKIIISDSRIKKTVNIFLSMFVFLYTIIPLENISTDINVDFNNTEYEYNDIYKNGYESIIKESINKICKDNNTSIIIFNIDSYIDDDGYLVVNSIEIKIDDESKNQIIKEKIKEKLDFEVTFI